MRFIEAFVDGLDLQAAGFARVHAKAMGRPGYDPADLLKLYIYGHLNRVRSNRRLEAETQRNIEVIWLLRHLGPNYKTIADFRRDDRSACPQVFREFVLLCRQLDLSGRELLAVDGTWIKAVNSKDRNFTRAALAKIIDDADEAADGGDVGRDNKLAETMMLPKAMPPTVAGVFAGPGGATIANKAGGNAVIVVPTFWEMARLLTRTRVVNSSG